VLVASSAPLDQFIVRHPSYFFDSSPEHALINPDNLHVLADHIKCAAFELPFREEDTFGAEDLPSLLGVFEEARLVHHSDGEWHWTSDSYPADAVSVRSITSDNFVVVDETHGPRVIGEVDFTSAPSTLHEKAIYLVEGQLYQVERLDYDHRKAFVREVDCDYYTDAIVYTKVTQLDEFAHGSGADASAPSDDLGELVEYSEMGGAVPSRVTPGREHGDGGAGAVPSHGEVHVVSRVVGFKKIKFYTNENVGAGDLDLPEQQMHTTAYWVTLTRPLIATLPGSNDDRRDAINGLAYAMRNVSQLLLMCDRQDLGLSVDLGALAADAPPAQGGTDPRVFLYDNYPGGIGFSQPLFAMHADLLATTRALIADCPCEIGCPSCVGPLGEVGPRAKAMALRLLSALLAAGASPVPPRAADRD
jgi:DEAD/DEAH box helicase domain-containing protein